METELSLHSKADSFGLVTI